MTLSIAYRIADGGEGSSIEVATGSTEQSAHVVYRITGHDSSNPPEVSTGNAGVTQYPNPDSLTPSWDQDDTLWIAVEGNDDDDAVTSYPANYTLGQHSKISNTGLGTCHIGVAARELNDSSEDPGSFTLAASEDCYYCTVAVCPGVAPSDVYSGRGVGRGIGRGIVRMFKKINLDIYKLLKYIKRGLKNYEY